MIFTDLKKNITRLLQAISFTVIKTIFFVILIIRNISMHVNHNDFILVPSSYKRSSFLVDGSLVCEKECY